MIKKILFLFVLIVLIALFWGDPISYIYKPSLLNEKKARSIIQTISLLNSAIDVDRMGILSTGDITLNGGTLWLAVDKDRDLFEKTFDANLRESLLSQSKILQSVNINYVEKIGSVYLVFTYYHKLFPTSEGMLFIGTDEDPNKITDKYISKYKPFIKIIDHWYRSDRLIIVRSESDSIKKVWPKALIDNAGNLSEGVIKLLAEYNLMGIHNK